MNSPGIRERSGLGEIHRRPQLPKIPGYEVIGVGPLIQPYLSGQRLLDEIRATEPAPGAVAVWWLGQSGYILKSRFGSLVIDPYLSEHLTAKYAGTDRPHARMTEAPLRGYDLTGVDVVVATH